MWQAAGGGSVGWWGGAAGLSHCSQDAIVEPATHRGECWEEVWSQWALLAFPRHKNETGHSLGGSEPAFRVWLYFVSHVQFSEPDGGRRELRAWIGTCHLKYPIIVDNRSALCV